MVDVRKWSPAAAARLREVREATMKQQDLAAATGIPIATLQRILAGSDPGHDRFERIIRALGVPASDILGNEAPEAREVRVPVYDIEVAAGAGRFTFDAALPIDSWPFPLHWLAQLGDKSELRLVTIVGDSQEPELSSGDMVMINIARTRLRDGMHVVRLDDALLLKRVQVRGSQVLLKSANPAYEAIVVDLASEAQQFEVIGQAVWASKFL